MIHLLIDKLQYSNNNDVQWKHLDNNLYNKYTQKYTFKCPEKINQSLSEIKEKPIEYVEKKVVKEKPIEYVEKKVVKEKPQIDKIKNIKPTIIKPLEIILSESCTFDNSLDDIKQKLVEFISKKEFSKVFGMTKSADIMSGIVNNRWNKSTALFISFLFNKSVSYNNSSVLYNSEQNKGVILTTI